MSLRDSSDWSERANAVRGIPLESILILHGAQRDLRDRNRWRTARGNLSVTGTQFMNWMENKGGGGAIDLVMHLDKVPYQEALIWLETHFGRILPQLSPPSAKRPRSLQLPGRTEAGLASVRHYLTFERHLRDELVESVITRGAIYADARRNAVFLMVQGADNKAVGAELRSTTNASWRSIAPGSQKDAGYFWTGMRGSERIILCESAIDALSCYQLLGQCICISTAGARSDAQWLPALLRRGYEIHNGFDNDDAGNSAAAVMIARYPMVQRLTPPAKDWNDALHRWT